MSALAAASGHGSGSSVGTLIFIIPILLLAFMLWSYFKRQRNYSRSQASLNVGDEVSTTSGLYGRLISLEDDIATLEVADGVRLRFDRRAVLPRAAVAQARRGRGAGASTSSTDTKA